MSFLWVTTRKGLWWRWPSWKSKSGFISKLFCHEIGVLCNNRAITTVCCAVGCWKPLLLLFSYFSKNGTLLEQHNGNHNITSITLLLPSARCASILEQYYLLCWSHPPGRKIFRLTLHSHRFSRFQGFLLMLVCGQWFARLWDGDSIFFSGDSIFCSLNNATISGTLENSISRWQGEIYEFYSNIKQ